MHVKTNFHTEPKLFRVLKAALAAAAETGQDIHRVAAEEDNDDGGSMGFVMDGRYFSLSVYEVVPSYMETMPVGGCDG